MASSISSQLAGADVRSIAGTRRAVRRTSPPPARGGPVALIVVVVAGLLATFAYVACAASPPTGSGSFLGEVIAIHDGDTISVRTGRTTVRIRLLGIDCPERGQPWSSRAKQFTSQLVFGRTVRVEGHGIDRYDRRLARVIVDRTDVNEALVRAGMAWVYDLDTPDKALVAAERAARAARAGLWSDPDPIPPWRWRRNHPQRAP